MNDIEKSLLEKVETLTTTVSEILDIVEQNNLDDSDIICNEYPFELSLDEQFYKIIEWRNNIRNMTNSMT